MPFFSFFATSLSLSLCDLMKRMKGVLAMEPSSFAGNEDPKTRFKHQSLMQGEIWFCIHFFYFWSISLDLWKEAVEKKSKAVCPYPLPKVEGLSPKLKQGKSSSPSRVNLQSQGLGVSHSTKDDDLATLVQHALDQASENLSPCRASRIQLLKLQFSDTILKANKTLQGIPDSPPRKKMMQRMKRRKLFRRAILNMEKSVQFEDPLQDLKQLEMLCGCGTEDPFLQVRLGLPLKKLGVFLREDDELQGQDEEAFLNGDWEEGEIWWEGGEICS